MSDRQRWICDSCGYDGLRAEWKGTVEFSVLIGCPVCGMSLRRDDPLGQIEAELVPPVDLLDWFQGVQGGQDDR